MAIQQLSSNLESLKVMSTDLKAKIISPCIKACNQDGKGLCGGCYRTISEIINWGTMSPDERQRIMSELPERKELCKKSNRIKPES